MYNNEVRPLIISDAIGLGEIGAVISQFGLTAEPITLSIGLSTLTIASLLKLGNYLQYRKLAAQTEKYLKSMGYKLPADTKKTKALLKKLGNKTVQACLKEDDPALCIVNELEKKGLIKGSVKTPVVKFLYTIRNKLKKLYQKAKENKAVAAAIAAIIVSIAGIIALGYKEGLIPGDKPWSLSFYKALIEKIKRLPTEKKALFAVMAGAALAGFAVLGYKAARIALQKIVALLKKVYNYLKEKGKKLFKRK